MSRLALEGAAEQEMIDAAVRAVAETLGVEMAKYMELSPEEDLFRLRGAIGWPEELIGAATVPASGGGSYAAFALSHASPDVVQDLRREARFIPSQFLTEMGVVSGLSAVVYGAGIEVLGALSGQSRSERSFDEHDAELLQTIANILSTGVLRRWSETRLGALVQNSSDLIVVVNDKAEIIYCNPAVRRLFGVEPGSVLGRWMGELVHPEDLTRAKEAFVRDLAAPGGHPSSRYRFSAGPGDWRVLEVVATNCLDDPSVRGVVFNARDVTEQDNLSRVLRTLSAGNRLLVAANDEATLLADACRTVVEVGGFPLAWVGYREHDARSSVRRVASAGRSAYVEEIRVGWGGDAYSNGPVGAAIKTGETQVVNDTLGHTNFAPWRERAERFGLRSTCALALRVGDEVIGAIAIYAEEAGAFGEREVSLLQELADDFSYGIARLRDAQSLHKSEQRFQALADEAPIGIVETSSEGNIEYANAKMREILGRSQAPGRWLDLVHPDDLAEVTAVAESVGRGEKTVKRFKICRPDGEVRHVRLSLAPKSLQGNNGLITTVEDVTEEALAQEALAYQAFHDSLTGLPNRAMFLDLLARELGRCRGARAKIAVLFLDIDHFKVVNDSLGHVAGDEVLVQVGERLRAALRGTDVLARFSGDEFILMLPGVRGAQAATKAAKRMLEALEAPVGSAGHDIKLSASIGIVIASGREDATTVLRDADAAMYRAKREGRNRWAVFDEGLHRGSLRRLSIEAELHKALERQELQLFYQPLVAPASGRPRSAEALVRWNHPGRGLVPPLEFIPVAEESGLIGRVGRWVFEEAVSQMAAWDAHEAGPHLDVLAVNLSARQLDDPGTPSFVSRTLKRHKVAANRICLEVTESVLMGDNASTRTCLRAFKALGLSIAIDDFGTGYSSLAYLHTLPVTTVKIDRSFVERLGRDDDSMPVVKAIVEMSHALGLSVVAEGVSDGYLQGLVSELGCEAAQGFYWSMPQPAREFAAWWLKAEQAGLGAA
ncbi:MAG TPA: EAL domain-containing protein [Acidimicrobiales bacterium]|nr:EAL domain-containing protein [Acidimicrobiales bacterium]